MKTPRAFFTASIDRGLAELERRGLVKSTGRGTFVVATQRGLRALKRGRK